MKRDYLERIVDAFYSLDISTVSDNVIHQIQRTLLDYLGCTIYSTSHRLCSDLVELVKSISAQGESSIWGEKKQFNLEASAFANASRTSTIELDDVSGMGASVHPGVYVWSSAFASFEKYHPDKDTVLKAVLFGYDLCLRMGLLSTENVRKLGLHGPGLNGAFASVATSGMLAGLSKKEIMNAICLAGSLLPICPFVSFLSGSDSKDFYGGWGCYLGMIAVNGAKRGMSGPEAILDGEKSLKSIYSGAEPDGEIAKDFLIEKISFKEFSACASVHPAVSALLQIIEQRPFSVNDVKKIIVETYPYSYQLNSGVEMPLNVSSARLYLPYAISVGVICKALPPDAFLLENIKSGKYSSLMDKVEVLNHVEYGDSSFSIRGAIVTVVLKNGEVLKREHIGSRWSKGARDEDLENKFKSLSNSAFDEKTLDEISKRALSFDGNLGYFIDMLKSL